MPMSLGKVFEPFVEQRPICVMARGVLENLFDADKIDALFARTAEVQYTRALLFSSVVDLMGQVVLGVQPSVHAAYQAQAVQLGISDQAIYDKLRQVGLRVSAELVRDAARQAAPVIEALQAELPPLVPGYRAKLLDGNHLAASEHRLEALRHVPVQVVKTGITLQLVTADHSRGAGKERCHHGEPRHTRWSNTPRRCAAVASML